MAKVFIEKATQDLVGSLRRALEYIEWEKIIPTNSTVFIKPNLTFPTMKSGVTTTPAFIEAVLQIFSDRSNHLIIGESDGGYRGWPAEMSFLNHNLPDITRRFGARLVNLSKERRVSLPINLSAGEMKLDLPALIIDEIDVFVTLPVPKIHNITTISGAIKNQWGCIPDNMRLLNHPYFDEMILEINRLVGTKMALADGTWFLNKSGPMFGEPVRMDMVIASDGIGAMDLTLCEIMQLAIEKIRYLHLARQRGWIPEKSQIGFNQSPEPFSRKYSLHLTPRSRLVRFAFDRPWAIRLFWNSWISDLLHKILYAIAGNKVKEAINGYQTAHHGNPQGKVT
jgi:uncharacterized protein (DUF362 family)